MLFIRSASGVRKAARLFSNVSLNRDIDRHLTHVNTTEKPS